MTFCDTVRTMLPIDTLLAQLATARERKLITRVDVRTTTHREYYQLSFPPGTRRSTLVAVIQCINQTYYEAYAYVVCAPMRKVEIVVARARDAQERITQLKQGVRE